MAESRRLGNFSFGEGKLQKVAWLEPAKEVFAFSGPLYAFCKKHPITF